ncbi:MAG: hypothetical protein JWN45_682 [Acidobacteriaceae bacterium]|nr:hypothetical protein [Acidobacteriaceae bacterium]
MTFTLWSRREQLGCVVEWCRTFEPISAKTHPLDPDPAEMSLLMIHSRRRCARVAHSATGPLFNDLELVVSSGKGRREFPGI